jgi:hypothetical protein
MNCAVRLPAGWKSKQQELKRVGLLGKIAPSLMGWSTDIAVLRIGQLIEERHGRSHTVRLLPGSRIV